MGLEAVRHEGAGAFLERAEAWLLEQEDRNNLILSLAHSWARVGTGGPEPFFCTVEDDGRVVGCAARTPPHKLLLTEVPRESVPRLVETVSDVYREIPGVVGPRRSVEAAATAWTRANGGDWVPGMHSRLYRLEQVTQGEGVSGSPRAATAADVDLLVEWGVGFGEDTGVSGLDEHGVARRVRAGEVFLWEESGEPVAMAVAQGHTAHGVRIGYVYTPPERRGRGYASALVGYTSQLMLDSGRRFCVLLTDMGNPTSNAIYQRLGYVPVCDLFDVNIRSGDVE